MREQAISAYGVLGYIGRDLVAAAEAFRHFQKPGVRTSLSQHSPAYLNRLCLNHIFIALCRWLEFYRRYHNLLEGEHHVRAKLLKKDLERRGLRRFRNEFLAHIESKELGRPMTDREISKAARDVAGGEFTSFVAWVHDYHAPEGSETVVRLVESQRNFIFESQHLTDRDVAPELFEPDA